MLQQWEEERMITASFWDDRTVIFNLEVENSVNSSSSDIINLLLITADALQMHCWWEEEDAMSLSELIAELKLLKKNRKQKRDKDEKSL